MDCPGRSPTLVYFVQHIGGASWRLVAKLSVAFGLYQAGMAISWLRFSKC
jgi:hypothetical protein